MSDVELSVDEQTVTLSGTGDAEWLTSDCRVVLTDWV
jgi:hypothetical protein